MTLRRERSCRLSFRCALCLPRRTTAAGRVEKYRKSRQRCQKLRLPKREEVHTGSVSRLPVSGPTAYRNRQYICENFQPARLELLHIPVPEKMTRASDRGSIIHSVISPVFPPRGDFSEGGSHFQKGPRPYPKDSSCLLSSGLPRRCSGGILGACGVRRRALRVEKEPSRMTLWPSTRIFSGGRLACRPLPSA